MSPVGGKITERELTDSIRRAARGFGWREYHTWNAYRSPKGFPDLVLVKPPRIIFAELKTDTGKLTPDQEGWLADLRAAGAEVFLWRPADIDAAYAVLMGEQGTPIG